MGDGCAVGATLFGIQGSQGLGCVFGQAFGDFLQCLGDDGLLLVLLAVGDLLLRRERAELEGDGERAPHPHPLSHRERGARLPGDFFQARQEEALLAFDVVLLHVGGLEFEMHRDAVGGLPGVIGEVLAGLDVVLVVVRPVEIDFLAVVGDGVALFFGVAAFGDEVAILPVAAEKGVEVVVGGGFQRLAVFGRADAFLGGQILFSGLCIAVLFGQVAIGAQRIVTQRFQHLLASRFQVLRGLRLVCQRAFV